MSHKQSSKKTRSDIALPPVRRVPRQRLRRYQPSYGRILKLLLLPILLLFLAGGILLACIFCSSPTVRDTMSVMISREDCPDRAFPGRDSVNILIMGRDQDRDRTGRVLHTRGRTDAIMLAHVDFRKRSIQILSIPRDSSVRVPGFRGKRRINSANALGGPDLVKQTVRDLVGVSPDYYTLMDFIGFEKAIDQIGGVNVNVDKELDYDDSWGNLHIHLKPGQQWMDGNKAIGFVRYRHANGGGGDSDLIRISRQQELVSAVKWRLAQPGVLMKVPGAIEIVRQHLQTDMRSAQLICLARFMKSLPTGSGVKMVTMPSLEGGGNYVKPDPDGIREVVGQIFFDKAAVLPKP